MIYNLHNINHFYNSSKKNKEIIGNTMNLSRIITPITFLMILITSCGSPSVDSKTKKILSDQEQLEKHGFGHKSEIESNEGALNCAYQFSMLQRFRDGRNFNAVDRYRPKN